MKPKKQFINFIEISEEITRDSKELISRNLRTELGIQFDDDKNLDGIYQVANSVFWVLSEKINNET